MSNIIIVGEIGINHNGDINLAEKLIDIADISGLDYVKFQKRDIDSVYTKEFLRQPRKSPWGITQGEQKLGLEFGKSEYRDIALHIEGKNNLKGWFASPWDIKSVDFLSQFDVPYMKVASPCITDFKLLEAIKDSNKPVIISTGMSTKDDVDKCINYLGDQIEFVLSCKSTYPTKNEDMNMNFIKTLKDTYPKYKIGFSNHNAGIQFCIIAAALGAEMIEFHITLDRSIYGSDQAASIETTGIFKAGHHIREIEKGMGTGQWEITPEEEKIREKLRR
jgi:N-acetylneuraminate synthase